MADVHLSTTGKALYFLFTCLCCHEVRCFTSSFLSRDSTPAVHTPKLSLSRSLPWTKSQPPPNHNPMTIYAFYIFDRHCSCIYSREYGHTNVPLSSSSTSQPSPAPSSANLGSVNKNNTSDTAKLLFGLIHSLKNLSSKLSTSDTPNLLRSFSTGSYRVHYLESLTSFKFVLLSDLDTENLQPQLWDLYSSVFLKTVVFNALSPMEFGDGKISNASFIQQSDKYLQALPVFY